MMPGDDSLHDAIDELYSADPDEFVKRRAALASQARAEGDPTSATAITALRRPTKAAWIVNRLVRADPDVAGELAELAKKLRNAQRTLDGTKLRELTQQRRKMIDKAIRQAFKLSGQTTSAASLRQEVASTLEAALADPAVAEQLDTGTLVRAAEWSGFGDATPSLSAVPPLRAASSTRHAKASAKPGAKAGGRAPETSKRAAQTESGGQARRTERIAQAEQALTEANEVLETAASAEREQDENVGLRKEQLADAARRLDEARLATRHAKAKQRDAQRRLERLSK
ncbi:MAG: hypothetical protein DLM58_18540 [Pseudonocardiales bacterium]|nr:MAG: hypothetical protein DLM58_18540 [Pseudonocardiales bacterium]